MATENFPSKRLRYAGEIIPVGLAVLSLYHPFQEILSPSQISHTDIGSSLILAGVLIGLVYRHRRGFRDDGLSARLGWWCLIGWLAFAIIAGMFVLHQSTYEVPSSQAELLISDAALAGGILGGLVGTYMQHHRQQNAPGDTQSQLERALDRIDGLFFSVDDEWRITYITETDGNVPLEFSNGVDSIGSLKGKNFWKSCPSLVDSDIEERFRTAMRTQEPVLFDVYCAPLNSWFDISVDPAPDGLSVHLRDITNRMEHEPEFNTLTEMDDFQCVPTSPSDMIFLLDEDLKFMVVTDQLIDFLGYSLEQLKRTRFPEILVNEDEDTNRMNFEEFHGCEGIENVIFESAFATAGGELRPVAIELSRAQGETHIVGRATDISDRSQTRPQIETERGRFQELFDNLPDPTVEIKFRDDVPIIQHVNSAFAEVFSYDTISAQGKNLNDLFISNPEQQSERTCDFRAIVEDQKSVEIQQDIGEEVRDYLVHGIQHSEGESSAIGFVVYTDITDQREYERYLTVLNRVLRHDLRNDMNIVLPLTQRLVRKDTTDEITECAERIRDSAQSVLEVTEKAREIERFVGTQTVETRPIDIIPYIRDAVEIQRDSFTDAEITLDVPEHLWVQATEDLHRAIQELIKNAIEHNHSHPPQLIIETRDVSDREGWIELRFSDNGLGIPDEEWRIISGETEVTQVNHGSGLGLWLTRWIVESYGGGIHRDQVDDRTTVAVTLRQAPRAAIPTSTEE